MYVSPSEPHMGLTAAAQPSLAQSAAAPATTRSSCSATKKSILKQLLEYVGDQNICVSDRLDAIDATRPIGTVARQGSLLGFQRSGTPIRSTFIVLHLGQLREETAYSGWAEENRKCHTAGCPAWASDRCLIAQCRSPNATIPLVTASSFQKRACDVICNDAVIQGVYHSQQVQSCMRPGHSAGQHSIAYMQHCTVLRPVKCDNQEVTV